MTDTHVDDERAALLLRLGLDAAVRIRDGEAAEVRQAFDAMPHTELRDIAVLLAGCVDVSRPVSELVWWTAEPVELLPRLPAGSPVMQPCGTPAAYRRHLVRGEPVDVACESAYLRYETERHREAA